MTEQPVVEIESPAPINIEQVILAVIQTNVHPLIVAAEQRISDEIERRMRALKQEQDDLRTLQGTTIQTTLERKFAALEDRLITQIVGFSATVAATKQAYSDLEKRRSDEMRAVRLEIESIKESSKEVTAGLRRVEGDLYGDPEQRDKKSLYQLVQEIQAGQSVQTNKLADLERKQAAANEKVEETSAYITNRKSLEEMVMRGARWLFATRSRAIMSGVAIPAVVGVGGGLVAAIADVVSKLLNP